MKFFYLLLLLINIQVYSIGQQVLNTAPLLLLLERVSPGLSAKFTLKEIPASNNADIFEIESLDNKIVVSGNSFNSITAGVGFYLKYYCNSGTYWCGERAPIPTKLPMLSTKIVKTTSYRHRYYMNWDVNNYSTAYWDWVRWEKEIDWMALNGVTIPFIQIDNSSVHHKLIERFTGHRTSADQKSYDDKRIELQQKVIQRMHELGINPALEGFNGTLPTALPTLEGFNGTFPVDSIVNRKVGVLYGNGYTHEDRRPYIHPNDPFFIEYGLAYYEEQKKLYGEQFYITSDPFVETGVPQGMPLDSLGLKIQELILKAYPKAIWILQGWQDNPRTELLKLTIPNKILILDLWCEVNPQWKSRDIYQHNPWSWDYLGNFGRNTGMYGNINLIFSAPREAKNSEAGKFLCGIGTTMEGIETNPAVFQAVYESAWYDQKPNIEKWLIDYAASRYGKQNVHANKAWAVINRTTYSATSYQQGESENIMCARPGLDVNRVSEWSTCKLYYNPKEFLLAWDELIAAGKQLKENDGYRFDLVDITRQVLSNYALFLYPEIVEAYKSKDKQKLSIRKAEFLTLFDDMNTVLASHKMFLLGPWIDRYVSWAPNEESKSKSVIAAKTRISTWGPKEWSEGMKLHDYSFREWEGIMSELYKGRWEKYLTALENSIQTGIPETIDWYAYDLAWIHNGNTYNSTPVGSPYQVCKKVYRKYRHKMYLYQ